MDDVLFLKEAEENDGFFLMDLFDYPLSYERAAYMARMLSHDKDEHMLIMSLDKVIGIVEMHEGEVGYRIRKEYQNKGFATKALALFLERYKGSTLKARAEVKNMASCRVLVKNGFEKVKETDGICYYVRHS